MHERRIPRRNVARADDAVHVRRVRVVVAAALAVLLAQAQHLVRLVRAARGVEEGVRLRVAVDVRWLPPDAGEEAQSVDGDERVGREAARGAPAGDEGEGGAAAEKAAVGWYAVDGSRFDGGSASA